MHPRSCRPREATPKPGSVRGGHLSRSRLSPALKRPYPRVSGQPHPLLFGLAPGGVCLACRSPDSWWALTPPFHPYPALITGFGGLLGNNAFNEAGHGLLCAKLYNECRAVCFCGTFLGLTPTGIFPAPCPVEPGLSSPPQRGSDRLGSFPQLYSLAFIVGKGKGRSRNPNPQVRSFKERDRAPNGELNPFRLPVLFLSSPFPSFFDLFPFCRHVPSARKKTLPCRWRPMGPLCFFSVRHGLQQLQPLHDESKEISSPVSTPDFQHRPPSMIHNLSHHAVEEKTEALRSAFSIF